MSFEKRIISISIEEIKGGYRFMLSNNKKLTTFKINSILDGLKKSNHIIECKNIECSHEI